MEAEVLEYWKKEVGFDYDGPEDKLKEVAEWYGDGMITLEETVWKLMAVSPRCKTTLKGG
jgi:hypothetical protein